MPRDHEIRYRLEESHHSLVAMAAFAHGADIIEYAREAVVRRATADLKELHPQLQELILRELGLILGDTGQSYRKKRGRIPDREEALAYYKEKGFTFAFDSWWDHYESNGWRVGKNPVMKWQATMGTFQRTEPQFQRKLDIDAERQAKNKAVTMKSDEIERLQIEKDMARIAAERRAAR